MAGVVVRINPHLQAEVERSEAAHHACASRAEVGVAYARQIAPVLSGTYRDSLHAQETDKGAQIVADPVNDQGNGYGGYVEVGTSVTPPHHVLGQTAAALEHL